VTAIAKDRCPVGDARDLIHAVRDVNDGDALRFELAKEGEEFLHFAARKGGRWLIEDENANITGDRLDDLSQLALAR
jgi:hypothetical protein